jgi:hypothetical protein
MSATVMSFPLEEGELRVLTGCQKPVDDDDIEQRHYFGCSLIHRRVLLPIPRCRYASLESRPFLDYLLLTLNFSWFYDVSTAFPPSCT